MFKIKQRNGFIGKFIKELNPLLSLLYKLEIYYYEKYDKQDQGRVGNKNGIFLKVDKITKKISYLMKKI